MSNNSCLSNSNIGYAGKVCVKVKDRKANRVLATFTNHNAGAEPLFSFLSLCLAGEYSTADALRPYKIKLFYNKDVENIGASADPTVDDMNAVSSFISMNTLPDVYGNSVIFHFIIPYSYISGEKVNQICLYGVDEKNSANYSARFYILDEKTGENGITVNRALSNLSLMIDWTLTLKDVATK